LSSSQIRFHYVQRAYLKNFSIAGREGEVFELNKETLTSKKKGVNEIAWEEFFYHDSMEDLFNKEFESKAPKVFRKIIERRIEELNKTDFEVLAKFVTYHVLRVKKVRLQIKAELELSGKQYSDENMKNLHDSTIRVSEDYKQLMKLPRLFLGRGEEGLKLVTSDVPVVIYNFKTPNDPKSYSCYSNGSIIMLPIDPNNVILYINYQENIKLKDLRDVLSHPNYYQIFESDKYIYSNMDDFSLIKSFIQTHELGSWTLEDRKAGIERICSSYPIKPDFGVDLYKKWGNRTRYSIFEEITEFTKNILVKIPKRELYTCYRCQKISDICLPKQHPELLDRCIECGEPIPD